MKEQISDLFEKITGEERGLERLLDKIPGISGYMEKGRRREADAMLRRTIADRLDESRKHLGAVTEELGQDMIKAIDHAEPLGRVNTRLTGLAAKIRVAPEGYSGFFDAVKVKEDDLARIYAFDEGMLLFSDEIEASVSMLEKAVQDDGDIKSAIRNLDGLVREADHKFNSRDEVILGIGDSDEPILE